MPCERDRASAGALRRPHRQRRRRRARPRHAAAPRQPRPATPITADDSPVATRRRASSPTSTRSRTARRGEGARYACDEDAAAIEIVAPTFGVDAGKTIAPATQVEGDFSPVTVTSRPRTPAPPGPTSTRSPTTTPPSGTRSTSSRWTRPGRCPSRSSSCRPATCRAATSPPRPWRPTPSAATWTCQELPGGGRRSSRAGPHAGGGHGVHQRRGRHGRHPRPAVPVHGRGRGRLAEPREPAHRGALPGRAPSKTCAPAARCRPPGPTRRPRRARTRPASSSTPSRSRASPCSSEPTPGWRTATPPTRRTRTST